ncbi:hypothetical protein [Alteromonas sp. H39]|uniref:hypothetical protein n=1 Tax=Alteromonas sp. H39 TaxID=3389876 RepID=UPI0039E05B4E
MRVLILFAMLLTAGCTTTVRDIPSTDSPISPSQSFQHCREVKRQCDALQGDMESEQGEYEQWDYEDGSVGCRCHST